jgi:hypothetical protein
MTHQRELDRLLEAFLAEGHDEVADRVIEAALDQIDQTHQRRVLRVPRRLQTMPNLTRLAAAAVIGVVAVGGALFLLRPGPTPVTAGPAATFSATLTPGPAPTPTPAPTATPAPSPASTPQVGLTGPIGAGRQIHAQVTLADGRVLVVGGYDVNNLALASASIYDLKTNTFTPTGAMGAARGLFTATLLTDGRVLVAGGGHASWVGLQGDPFLASAELYDPKTGTFSPTGSMTTAREDHTATRLRDGRVLIVGGDDATSHGVATAEIYDPKTGTFSPTGSMATPRGFHTATLLADGRVLVAGGDTAGWTSSGNLATAELYDPKTGTFTATGSMSTTRAYHAATRLPDGRVLVTGGADNGATDLASAEIYDPKTGTFTAAGSMTIARLYHSATLLADGRVLIAGGGGDYTNLLFIATAEIFDPKTGTFTRTGSLATARTYHAATLLASGRVLVTGGYGGTAPLASAELYDPKTGTFSPAGAGG